MPKFEFVKKSFIRIKGEVRVNRRGLSPYPKQFLY